MMMENKRQTGYEYEQKAAKYLEQKGYRILESNYNSRTGEIDLVTKDGEYYAFVEVKYRSNTKQGLPEEAVDYRKMRRITLTAQHYFVHHKLSEFTPCRFDVVVILKEEIRLIQNAFDAIL